MARIVKTLPIGTNVTPKDEMLENFYAEAQRKIKGRTGQVVTHAYPYKTPIVDFPAIGRKKAYRMRLPGGYMAWSKYFDIDQAIIDIEMDD